MQQGKRLELIAALQENWKAEMRCFYTYSHLAEQATDASDRRALRTMRSASPWDT